VTLHLSQGLTVLDLGCGTGRDVYLTAQLVGEKGTAIGVDMTGECKGSMRRRNSTVPLYLAKFYGHTAAIFRLLFWPRNSVLYFFSDWGCLWDVLPALLPAHVPEAHTCVLLIWRVLLCVSPDEQLEVARTHEDWHRAKFGFPKSNVRFLKGFIEDLKSAGVEDRYSLPHISSRSQTCSAHVFFFFFFGRSWT